MESRVTVEDILREQRDSATRQLQDQEVELIITRDQRDAMAQRLAELTTELERLEEIINIKEQGQLTQEGEEHE